MKNVLLSLSMLAAPSIDDAGIQGVHRLTEIEDGIYVAEPRFGGANATIIISEKFVTLVDPSSSPANGIALVEEVKALSDKPLRYVINTHWHGDHHGGNAGIAEAVDEPVTFISHPLTREDIVAEATPELRQYASFYQTFADKAQEWLDAGVDDDGGSLTAAQHTQVSRYIRNHTAFVDAAETYEYLLPTMTVDHKLTIHDGERTMEVRSVGRAHTRSDLIVYLPDEKIVVGGDLLTAPYVVPRSGYPHDYAQVLRDVAAMDFDQLVLGHGGPIKTDTQLLLLMADFMDTIVIKVTAAQKAGMTVDDGSAAARQDPEVNAFETRIDWDEPGLRFLDFERLVSMSYGRAWEEATMQ